MNSVLQVPRGHAAPARRQQAGLTHQRHRPCCTRRCCATTSWAAATRPASQGGKSSPASPVPWSAALPAARYGLRAAALTLPPRTCCCIPGVRAVMQPGCSGHGRAAGLQGCVFSDAYSGAKEPLTLAAFLHTWWLHAECHQASYQQQDAHEFYLNALQGLGNSEASARAACSCGSAGAPLPQPGLPSCLVDVASGLVQHTVHPRRAGCRGTGAGRGACCTL